MDEAVKSFLALAFNEHVLACAGGVFVLIRAGQKANFSTHPLYRRILPLLPEILGVLFVVSGAVPTVAQSPIPLKIAVGLWCSYVAQKFQKILGQTILGDDRHIEAKAVVPSPESVGTDTEGT